MSFPERLTLSHLIDGEYDNDAVVVKEHQTDMNYYRSLEASSPVGATTPEAAVVNGDAGKPVTTLAASVAESVNHLPGACPFIHLAVSPVFLYC